MTTYADFQTYYLRAHWRTGDADLIADFDKLVVKAESRIKRDLRQNELPVQITLTVPAGSHCADLPGRPHSIEAVRMNEGMNFALPTDMQRFQNAIAQECFDGSLYAIALIPGEEDGDYSNGLYININSDTDEYVKVWLGQDFPSYTTDPNIPYYDIEPDFYEAALNVQVYKYLREFELSNEYQAEYLGLLEDMRTKALYERYPSGPINAPLPGSVM